ncbi:MAG: hypothetical protein C5B55_13935 [Blastocatellia bacterium]|nr:MAG: hypothetical protein C5B55_13935 [Blastocatellia bacterium]
MQRNSPVPHRFGDDIEAGSSGFQRGRGDCECVAQTRERVALIKVSFVPDHLHIALRVHPAVCPSDTVVALMNSAQETVGSQLIRAGIDRLWQPSAYVGSYGELTTAQVRRYIDNWEKRRD